MITARLARPVAAAASARRKRARVSVRSPYRVASPAGFPSSPLTWGRSRNATGTDRLLTTHTGSLPERTGPS